MLTTYDSKLSLTNRNVVLYHNIHGVNASLLKHHRKGSSLERKSRHYLYRFLIMHSKISGNFIIQMPDKFWEKCGFSTRAIHSGQEASKCEHNTVVPPIFNTTNFKWKSLSQQGVSYKF